MDLIAAYIHAAYSNGGAELIPIDHAKAATFAQLKMEQANRVRDQLIRRKVLELKDGDELVFTKTGYGAARLHSTEPRGARPINTASSIHRPERTRTQQEQEQPERISAREGTMPIPMAGYFALFRQSLKDYPALKFGWGIIGATAILAIVVGLIRSLWVAGFGLLLIFVGLIAFYGFSEYVADRKRQKKSVGFLMGLLFVVVILLIIAAVILFLTSLFFGWPAHGTKLIFGSA